MLKKILLLLVLISTILLPANLPEAYSVPQLMRVGIYYKDSAVSAVSIKSNSGMTIACKSNGSITELLAHYDTSALVARKDSWFKRYNGALTETNESGALSYEGTKVGPYHIQIGGAYSSYSDAFNSIESLTSIGIDSFVAYDGNWYVWSGFHISNADALNASISITDKTGANCEIIQPSNQRIVVERPDGQAMLVFIQQSCALQFLPGNVSDSKTIDVRNVKYRGAIEVKRLTGSDMTVINELGLEEYLYGVVPKEIESFSNIEALKAQAIAARTYCIKNMSKHSSLGFNVCPTTCCQVYGGYAAETSATNSAIDQTMGKIVTYNGSLASVYYFSSSGGFTEDVRNVWGSVGYPYLISAEDKYEKGNSWNYNWSKTLTISEMSRILDQKGYNIGTVVSVNITKVSETGRVLEMVVKGTNGSARFEKEGSRLSFSLASQLFTVASDSNMIAMNGEFEIKTVSQFPIMAETGSGTIAVNVSNSSELKVMGADGEIKEMAGSPTVYTFKGKGWGHAVGMSQEGAKGMANAGYTCEEILAHYYPGTKVE
ncbi:MAG: SpoIID/LytB domain-containing protein [Eubacteriales bacterium]|nr:SpoIID/LytB domain-containing protein [Eubacteriales bacterium]